jgi:hypothetical protein
MRPPIALILAIPLLAAVALPAACAAPSRPLPANAASSPSAIERVDPPIAGFYSRRLFLRSIPILGHSTVGDEGMLAARDVLSRMLANAPRVLANLEAAHHELHVIGLKQFPSDLPEQRAGRGTRIETGELYDWHMVGGHLVGRKSSCTEATLIGVVGHRLYGTEPCYHELAHAVEWWGLSRAGRDAMQSEFHRSIDSHHWTGEYASKNASEWFAEMTRYYFRPDGDALNFYDTRLARGRAWLKAEDPDAFRFVDDLYSGRFDPGVLTTIKLALGPGTAEPTLRSARSRRRADFIVHNRSALRLHVIWVDFDGHRDPRGTFKDYAVIEPGGDYRGGSFTGHTFVLTDDAGRPLCSFAAGEEDGDVEFTKECN